MWQAVWNIISELSPWLLLGAAVAGLMHLFVPAGLLKRLLQGRGGLLASVLVGIPLPLCSCSVIPVAIGLRKEGASRGSTVGFLVSTPQTGVDSILVSGAMLGWPFAMVKVVAALVMGLIGGALTEALGGAENSDPEDAESTSAAFRVQPRLADRVQDALQHSLELLRSIWRWLVIGILVSAAITWLLPASQLEGLRGASGISAMLLALLVSLPLYVCATASVPIAAALVASGLPAGAAMVFLMAGPATNLATMGAVYRTFGVRSTALYLATMIVGSIAAGLIFDSVIPVSAVNSLMQHEHTSWWSLVSSVALLGLLGKFALEDLTRWLQTRRTTNPDLTFHISGMNCENCAAGLERDIRNVDGVSEVTVRFSTEQASIHGNPNPETITQLVADKGFTATQTDAATATPVEASTDRSHQIG